ncbi:MAG: IclR family transcriptional regulator [Syntrophobacterales bacterium]|nr:MAG: IclR family transcriptional regulator [Syntrophobacterales bacterium]
MKKGNYAVPSVVKAFKVLEIISESGVALSISELSRRLGLSKGTVFAIASTLQHLGVLVRDPVNKKFSLGYTLLELGRRAFVRKDPREIARKPMEDLVEDIEETTFLGVLNGDHITILDVVESKRELKITAPSGTRLPLLAGATGKVFLATMESARVRELVKSLGLTAYTPHSTTDVDRYMEEIEEVRKKGFAIDDEEYIRGVRAVACPLEAGPLPHAIWVVGFTTRLDDKKMGRVIEELRKTSHSISKALRG